MRCWRADVCELDVDSEDWRICDGRLLVGRYMVAGRRRFVNNRKKSRLLFMNRRLSADLMPGLWGCLAVAHGNGCLCTFETNTEIVIFDCQAI